MPPARNRIRPNENVETNPGPTGPTQISIRKPAHPSIAGAGEKIVNSDTDRLKTYLRRDLDRCFTARLPGSLHRGWSA